VVAEEVGNKETSQTSQATRSAYNEIKIIELFGKEDPSININMEFLGLDLSKVPTQNMNDTKVFIIPFLYVIFTFINIKMTTKLSETAESKKKKEEEKLREEEEKAKKVAEKAKKKEFERELKKADKDAKAMIKTEVTEELEQKQQDDMPDVTGMTKGMNYLMPLLSISIAIVAPLGLSLYWLVSIILQLLERIAINAASKINEKEA
jgi:membrane protein insertase Oxa1/YidC/SpoIIIJ